jgi:hypothetical protein
MRLSEAIREGAKLRPQCQMGYFRNDYPYNEVRSCAIGAAYEGCTGKNRYELPDNPFAEDMLLDAIRECTGVDLNTAKSTLPPLPGIQPGWIPALLVGIVGLNDDYDWTREEIADWLEKQGF